MLPAHEKKFLHALLLTGAEYDAIQKLRAKFNSFEAAWRAEPAALTAAGLSAELAAKIAVTHSRLNPDDEMRKLVASRIAIVAADDGEFPAELLQIASPPVAVYIKGRIRKDLPHLAVVGTRKATAYGREAARKIIRELALKTDIAIVSGLAQGIDTEAHKAALEARVPTVGVLGGGMDRASFFPPENWQLAEQITASGGAVISEYPPGTPAQKHHFPARNRIIAGLCKGVLVVEAPERSGALITARFAVEENREVFAIPGPLFSPNTAGVHRLIQDGAKLVAGADDIIEELGLTRRTLHQKMETVLTPLETRAMGVAGARSALSLTGLTDGTERTILMLLGEPASVDEIKEKTNMATPAIIACLSLLELKGIVRPMGQNKFQRII